MYGSYLKISFSFIVANPTILHRYKCLCSVSGVRARIYAFYLLYLLFYSLLKPPTPPFFVGIEEKCYSSFNDGIYMSSDKKVDLFCLSCVFFWLQCLLLSSPSLPTHTKIQYTSEYVKDLFQFYKVV